MKTIKIALFFLSILLMLCINAFSYIIIAVEEGSVTYEADGNKQYPDKGRYKIYFEIDEASKTITRTKVVWLTDDSLGNKAGHVERDNTIYQIIEPPQLSILKGEKVIHAIGQPGINATELLTIGKNYIMQSKSTGDYVVVVNSKIIERSNVETK